MWATWYDGYNACVNALNADGSGWAGNPVCAYPGDANRGHGYCACQLRYGYGYGQSNNSHGYSRQFW